MRMLLYFIYHLAMVIYLPVVSISLTYYLLFICVFIYLFYRLLHLKHWPWEHLKRN